MMGNKDDERARYDFISYVKTKRWTLNGRIGTGGVTQARFNYDRGIVALAFAGSFAADENNSGFQAEAAVRLRDTTLEAKVQGPTLALSYSQALAASSAVGTELLFSPVTDTSRLRFVGAFGNQESTGSLISSYSTGHGADQLHVAFVRQVARNLDFGVGTELSYEPKNKTWASLFRFGYQFKTDRGSMTKATIDSTGTVTAMMEESLSEAAAVTFSAKVNYPKNTADFGIGLNFSV